MDSCSRRKRGPCRRRIAARSQLFVFFLMAAGEAERADDRRQGEALQDERDEDDGEGEKENQIALSEGLAVRERVGQRECGGKRDDPAHSCPADDEDGLWAGSRYLLVKKPSANEDGEGGSGKDPEKPQNDEHEGEEQAVELQACLCRSP